MSMLELRTGLPGSGKTLSVVADLLANAELPEGKRRPVYALGVDGLRDDLAEVITEAQLRDWQSLPAGSLVVVDEAQKYMGAKGAQEAPAWVLALSEHRHAGIDFILTTQFPTMLHTHVRRLVEPHKHYVRMFGTNTVQVYRWSSVEMNPAGKGPQKKCEQKSYWRYPTTVFAAYKSAELHTVKRRIPRFVWVAFGLLIVVPLLAWGAVSVMRHLSHPNGETPKVAALPGFGGASASVLRGKSDPVTAEEWVRQRVPRIAGVPWSAPMYDSASATTVPDLHCIKIEDGDECRCYTEQGTRDRSVPDGMCRVYVRDGVYNPLRPVAAPAPASAVATSQDAPRAPLAASAGVSWGGPVSGIPQSWTPPEATTANKLSGRGR